MTKSKTGRRKGRKTNSGNPVDRLLVNSNKPTGSTTTVVETDLIQRRQNFNLVQSPPKNLGNQIYWLRSSTSYDVAIPASPGSAYTESNFLFQLSALSNSSQIGSLFDQYCIYAVTVSIFADNVSSSYGQSLVVHTALDYDNVASVGPTAILGFNSCETSALTVGDSIVRFVKPCVAGNVYGSSAFGSYSTQRIWLDMASKDVSHYGVRMIVIAPPNASSLRVTQNFVVGLRNTI